MKVSARQYAEALLSLSQELPKGELAARFGAYLARRKEARRLPEIAAELERLDRKRTGRTLVRVTTARKLTAKERERLSEEAQRLFPEAETLDFHFSENKALLGGFVIETDEVRFDRSVKYRKNALEHALLA
jgi:F0F1-type ATP synthase delta subunit